MRTTSFQTDGIPPEALRVKKGELKGTKKEEGNEKTLQRRKKVKSEDERKTSKLEEREKKRRNKKKEKARKKEKERPVDLEHKHIWNRGYPKTLAPLLDNAEMLISRAKEQAVCNFRTHHLGAAAFEKRGEKESPPFSRRRDRARAELQGIESLPV